ncbi:MAG: chain length determinant protein tyrosine kinase EpsG [Burkholderiaceae bacterium]
MNIAQPIDPLHSEAPPAPIDASPPPARAATLVDESRRIGAILVDLGRLSLDDAGRILAEQQRSGQPFGDIAQRMGLVDADDVRQALARQFAYPYLRTAQEGGISPAVLAAHQPFSPFVEALRDLRSQLLLRWLDGSADRRCLTIASPDRAEGRSFLAANLAVLFVQIGYRTLLLDADLRHPSLHRSFGLDGRSGLTQWLAGLSDEPAIVPIAALPGLSVLPAGLPPPNPQELLSRPRFGECLAQLAQRFDVVVADTSACAESSDAMMVASRARGALIVGRNAVSRVAGLEQLEAGLVQSGAEVIGAVFNEH